MRATFDTTETQKRSCNDCNWTGKLEDCVMCGAVGPLCPECYETTLPDNEC